MTTFPTGFLWGAASSAHQVEGGNVGSDWWQLEHSEAFATLEPSRDACDSYHRYNEDLDLIANAGLTSYRFSIEWARIEPSPGEFSASALQHYQRVIEGCLERDLEPVVTLHHFTNPIWVRQGGAWLTDYTVERFARYVETVTRNLRGVSRFCTINEPNIIATFSGSLIHPAATTQTPDAAVVDRLVRAHRMAVEAIRSAGAQAGMTVAMTAYTTDGSTDAERALNAHRAADEDVLLEAARGDDFLGVQAYTRRFVTGADGVRPHGDGPDAPSTHRTQSGWNYYPRCVGDCLRRAHELLPGTPLLVTENGIATSNDEERIAYTSEALASILEAVDQGVRVDGYWHWSLLDSFEWVHGYQSTFGLVAVDRQTFARTPKPSLDWLGRVAKANSLAR